MEDLTHPERGPPFSNPQNASNLIKLDMLEIDTRSSLGKCVEIFDDETATWVPWRIRKIVVDGRVQLESVRDPSLVKWTSLEQTRYRWVTEHAVV